MALISSNLDFTWHWATTGNPGFIFVTVLLSNCSYVVILSHCDVKQSLTYHKGPPETENLYGNGFLQGGALLHYCYGRSDTKIFTSRGTALEKMLPGADIRSHFYILE